MLYDALIVGGRVAGASLALQLAREGRSVLVADRDAFPSDSFSTHFMNPMHVALLRKLGVLEDIEAAGFRRVTRHRTWVDDCLFEGPAGPAGAYSLTPRRTILDTVLIDHAVRAGARFMERTLAERLVEEDGRVAGAVLKPAGGQSLEVRAKVVVGADGRSSSVARWVGADAYVAYPPVRPVYYAYFRGFQALDEPSLEVLFKGEHLAIVMPMRPDEDCLGLEFRPDEFGLVRANPLEAFLDRFSALPGMRRRLRDARVEGKIMGSRGIENYIRTPYGPGWALVGDAGCLKDPATGTGVGDALLQSEMLAVALNRWFDGAPWDTSMAHFHRNRDDAVRPALEMAVAVARTHPMRPEELAWVRAAVCMPALARTLAGAMPAVLPDVCPPALAGRLDLVASAFGAAPAAAA